MVQIKEFPNYKITKEGKIYSVVNNIFLKPSINTSGYYSLNLWKNKKPYHVMIHQIMAVTFLNHKPNGQNKVVDHIDCNKLNNNIENLQIITQRQNSNKDKDKPKSGYKGVYWNNLNKKWQVRLRINNKKRLLGYYNNPITAHKDYVDFCEYIDKYNLKSEKQIKEKIKLYRLISDNYKNKYKKIEKG